MINKRKKGLLGHTWAHCPTELYQEVHCCDSFSDECYCFSTFLETTHARSKYKKLPFHYHPPVYQKYFLKFMFEKRKLKIFKTFDTLTKILEQIKLICLFVGTFLLEALLKPNFPNYFWKLELAKISSFERERKIFDFPYQRKTNENCTWNISWI